MIAYYCQRPVFADLPLHHLESQFDAARRTDGAPGVRTLWGPGRVVMSAKPEGLVVINPDPHALGPWPGEEGRAAGGAGT